MYFSFNHFLLFFIWLLWLLSFFFLSFVLCLFVCVCVRIMSDMVFCVPMWNMFLFPTKASRASNSGGWWDRGSKSKSGSKTTGISGCFIAGTNMFCGIVLNWFALTLINLLLSAFIERSCPYLKLSCFPKSYPLCWSNNFFFKDVGSVLGVFVSGINTQLFRLQNQMSKGQALYLTGCFKDSWRHVVMNGFCLWNWNCKTWLCNSKFFRFLGFSFAVSWNRSFPFRFFP